MSSNVAEYTPLIVNDVFMVNGRERDYGRLVNQWLRVISLRVDNYGNRHLGVVSIRDPLFRINDITEYGFNHMGYISKIPRD